MNPNSNRAWLALALAGLAVTVFGALRSSPPSGQGASPIGPLAATVNGAPISLAEWQTLLSGLANESGAAPADVASLALDSLIDQELLYQAGVRAGILQNDPVIRRRVVQLQLEQLTAQLREPSDSELRDYFAANRARYTSEPQVQFRQLFFPSRGSDATPALQAAAELRQRIANERDFIEIEGGWPEKLRAHDNDLYYPQSRLASLYGRQFAARLSEVEAGQLLGPLPSSLGVHLLWVRDLRPATIGDFEALRPQVEQDWLQAQRTDLARQYLAKLRQDADIQILIEGALRAD